jgi:two-component system, NarL family, invasion response regulator UvrY
MIDLRKILLVEDHPLVRAGCRRVLQTTGAFILEAENGSEALRISQAERPDLVVLDVNLPGLNGLAVLEKLLADRPDLPVVILSMYEDRALASRLMKHGASAYVTKRDDPETILRAVRQVCEGGVFLSAHLAPGQGDDQEVEGRLSDLSTRDQKIVALLGEG